jgi:hypothetical protein
MGVILFIGGIGDQVQALSGAWYLRIDGLIVASMGVYFIRQGIKRLRAEKEQPGPVEMANPIAK